MTIFKFCDIVKYKLKIRGVNMLHTTTHAKGNKMEGFISISTSTLNNKFCQKMAENKDSICSKCYARTFEKLRPSLHEAVLRNDILGKKVLSQKEIAELNITHLYVRFNSFGELINKTHVRNLVKIAEYYPESNFALWTKRANLCKDIVKPENLFLVYSSPKMNEKAELPENFDKVFTVYKKKFVDENDIKINCLKKCNICLKCYTRNDITEISEQLK